MSSSVDQIKSKIDIVSLVGSYIKLEKAGANFKGRCPFHNEKTPSFFVSPDRGSYYCFGCQAKGDIFTFVQEFEGLDFIGSLKVLAERAGVELEQLKSGEKSERERLFLVLEKAVFFYEKKLSENKEALEYLHKRGVSDDSIKNFRIGYAPADWRELLDYLLSKGVTEKDMLSVGLIKQKDSSLPSRSSYYDTFRGRIMFPIADSSGRVVGFSGRILVPDEKSPKYLNTPETELFNKSEILFGLDKAKKDIRLKGYSILVEGQMDLVMMHQAGLTNTVASSGTALTEMHLEKLRRLSERIMMSFDSDSAGFNASDRSAKIALSLGMDLKLVQMPEGKDPADLAFEDPELLKECFRNSKSIVDFYVDTLLSKNLDPKDLAIEIRKNVLPYIAQMKDKTDQSQWINVIKKKTFLNEEALWEDLKKIGVGANTYTNLPLNGAPPGNGKRVDTIERRVYGIILWLKEQGSKNKTEGEIVDKIGLENRAKEIFKERWEELEKIFEKEKELLLFETESYYNNKSNLEKDIDELLVALEEEYLKKELGFAMISLQKAEQKKDSSEVLKYLEECQRITQRINTIKTIKNAYEKK
ncbi:MAG: DNA primase [Parcubacteria bacterium C7867-006]|nr:MAG: DNA primase [Parcubacteria bacterium C7867-006]